RRPGEEDVTRPPFLKVQSGEQLIQGFAGCNNFTGSWFFTGNDFVFSRITATRMACPVGMEVEDTFLQALDNSRRYTIRGDILSLHDRRGRVLARLRYSRQLTDLDFRFLPSTQEEAGESSMFPDEGALPKPRTVETKESVPSSVTVHVVEANEKKVRSKFSGSGNVHAGRDEVTILNETKKTPAGSRTVQVEIQPEKEAAFSPKRPVSPVVDKDPKDKVEMVPAPEYKEEKVTGQHPPRKIAFSDRKQNNKQAEERRAAKASGAADESNESDIIQVEPESTGNGIAATVPEAENDGQKKQSQPSAPRNEDNITEPEVEEEIPADDMSLLESQEEGTNEEPQLSTLASQVPIS
ncbi:MAG: META domain-containing protein, partial [Candidatus Electrothrix sp. ATG2]|nr:META domain-containing protein [Candidatus Electrothrix sp. ATG2]